MITRPTADDMRRHRDEHESSMQEAKRVLLAEWRTESLRELRRQVGETGGIEGMKLLMDRLIAFMLRVEEDNSTGAS